MLIPHYVWAILALFLCMSCIHFVVVFKLGILKNVMCKFWQSVFPPQSWLFVSLVTSLDQSPNSCVLYCVANNVSAWPANLSPTIWRFLQCLETESPSLCWGAVCVPVGVWCQHSGRQFVTLSLHFLFAQIQGQPEGRGEPSSQLFPGHLHSPEHGSSILHSRNMSELLMGISFPSLLSVLVRICSGLVGITTSGRCNIKKLLLVVFGKCVGCRAICTQSGQIKENNQPKADRRVR